jgi:dual specificity MAP kinase phosphatase
MTENNTPPSPLSRIRSLLRVGAKAIMMRFYDQGSRRWTGRPVWAYSRITPQLYVGGQHRKRGWGAMGKEGITAVVNMREAHLDDAKRGVHGKNYLHLPTIDNTPPTLDDLERGAKFIHDEIAKGGKVYVHCGVGVGRAPTQAAAYFIYIGMTTDEALSAIKAKRPFIHLTRTQHEQLRAFEAQIDKNKVASHP